VAPALPDPAAAAAPEARLRAAFAISPERLEDPRVPFLLDTGSGETIELPRPQPAPERQVAATAPVPSRRRLPRLKMRLRRRGPEPAAPEEAAPPAPGERETAAQADGASLAIRERLAALEGEVQVRRRHAAETRDTLERHYQDLRRADADAKRLAADLAAANQRVSDTEARLTAAQHALEEARSEAARHAQRIGKLEERLSRARKEIKPRAARRIAELRIEARNARAEATEQGRRRQSLEEELRRRERADRAAGEAHATSEAKLELARLELESVRGDLQAERERARQEQTALRAARDRQQAEAERLRGAVAQAGAASGVLSQLWEEIARRAEEAETLEGHLQELKEGLSKRQAAEAAASPRPPTRLFEELRSEVTGAGETAARVAEGITQLRDALAQRAAG
jgi:chromosome segregation ATPase